MNAMTLTTPQVTEPSVSIVTSDVNALEKSDRCDRCRAQAYGRVTMRDSGFELLFCGHHLAAHMPKLLPQASQVEDYRAALNEKP